MEQTKTDRLDYEQPKIRIVELLHLTPLLQTSANINVTYTEEDWDNE